MKKNKHSLKISRSYGDITLDGYPIATYSNDELKILKNLLEKVLCEVNEYIKARRMKELKVGERVTLEVTETDKESCKGCFFDSKKFCEVWQQYPCSIKERSDHKNVIFKEVKE